MSDRMSLSTMEFVEEKVEKGAGVVRRHRLPVGAELEEDGAVRFRIWAPGVHSVAIEIDEMERVIPLEWMGEGWFELTTHEAGVGSRYRYVLQDGRRVPDAASRYQPMDVHGPSEVIDPAAYAWKDGEWKGRRWEEAVLYEMHVGTFTEEGTFRAAIEKLDHLVELGVTGIELMPVADFAGRRGWGYDGVLMYAPNASYGRPEDLKALVDAAHARGLMVILDVVYNHFGPEGNYLPSYAPQIFNPAHTTPWGAAVNYDGEGSEAVREFVINNAIYWVKEFHFDGLRLDAVHAIKDDSAKHVLEELAERVREAAGERQVHLILENAENHARRLGGGEAERECYTAQWNDDVHHALHTAATGEDGGYYADFKGDTKMLARALAEGFARGEASGELPPDAFVTFLQNHDQVGNRALGDRLHAIVEKRVARAVAAVYLLLPQVPMLFMGEEWGSRQPFPYFCDFGGELAEKVREGRREEFKKFPEFQDESKREQIPDPLREETFRSGKLAWKEGEREDHAEWLGWYREILRARRERIVPLLEKMESGGRYRVVGRGAVEVKWELCGGGELVLRANLSEAAVEFEEARGEVVWSEGVRGEGWWVEWLVRERSGDFSGG